MLSDQKVIALIEISNSFFNTFFKRMDTVAPAHSICGIDRVASIKSPHVGLQVCLLQLMDPLPNSTLLGIHSLEGCIAPHPLVSGSRSSLQA